MQHGSAACVRYTRWVHKGPNYRGAGGHVTEAEVSDGVLAHFRSRFMYNLLAQANIPVSAQGRLDISVEAMAVLLVWTALIGEWCRLIRPWIQM